jgi:pimeloyl-ACP methyl ester carboxylesterase
MDAVVIVPWFNYWKTSNREEFGLLTRKLEEEGFKVYLFDYEQRPEDLDDLLLRMNKLISNIREKKINLIGYSLGAYLSSKYADTFKENRIKSILLCFPLIKGSKFFRTIYRLWPGWKRYSGKVLHDASYETINYNRISKKIKVGIIRGNKRVNRRIIISSLAQFFLLFRKNDGLFAIDESNIEGIEKKTINAGHYEGLRRKIFIDSVKDFLRNGKLNI